LTKAVKKTRKKKNQTFIDINPDDLITEQSLVRVLHYLYTGQVDLSTLKPLDAVVYLMRAAQVYQIERLMQICQQYMQANITLGNIYKLLRCSTELQVKRAKDLALDFSCRNPAVVGNVEGAKELGLELFQEVVMLLQKPTDKIQPIEVTQPNTIVEDFKKLYEQRKQTGDVSFIIDGAEVKAHRALLAGKSKKFVEVVEAAEKTKMGEVVRLPIPLSNEAFLCMLRWAYYGDERIDPMPATALINFSKHFSLTTLRKVSEDKNSPQHYTVYCSVYSRGCISSRYGRKSQFETRTD